MEERKTKIAHPSHYNANTIEVIDIIEDYKLDFVHGNIIKYVLRAPYKDDELEDLKKARWYINRAINKLEDQGGNK